jgi:hypothetical protein
MIPNALRPPARPWLYRLDEFERARVALDQFLAAVVWLRANDVAL